MNHCATHCKWKICPQARPRTFESGAISDKQIQQEHCLGGDAPFALFKSCGMCFSSHSLRVHIRVRSSNCLMRSVTTGLSCGGGVPLTSTVRVALLGTALMAVVKRNGVVFSLTRLGVHSSQNAQKQINSKSPANNGHAISRNGTEVFCRIQISSKAASQQAARSVSRTWGNHSKGALPRCNSVQLLRCAVIQRRRGI